MCLIYNRSNNVKYKFPKYLLKYSGTYDDYVQCGGDINEWQINEQYIDKLSELESFMILYDKYYKEEEKYEITNFEKQNNILMHICSGTPGGNLTECDIDKLFYVLEYIGIDKELICAILCRFPNLLYDKVKKGEKNYLTCLCETYFDTWDLYKYLYNNGKMRELLEKHIDIFIQNAKSENYVLMHFEFTDGNEYIFVSRETGFYLEKIKETGNYKIRGDETSYKPYKALTRFTDRFIIIFSQPYTINHMQYRVSLMKAHNNNHLAKWKKI